MLSAGLFRLRKKTLDLMRSLNYFSLLAVLLVLYCAELLKGLNLHLRAGIGLTDEAYPLLYFSHNSSVSLNFVPPFIDLLKPLFVLANDSIYIYRIIGLLLLFIIVFLIQYFLRGIDLTVRTVVIAHSITAIFLIPSIYRYLFITPSYQWTIMVSSIAISFLLFIEDSLDQHSIIKRNLIHFSIGALSVVVFICRPQGGFLLLVLATPILYLRNLGLKNFGYFLTPWLVFGLATLLNFRSLRQRFINLYEGATAINSAFNLQNQITSLFHVFLPIILFLAILGLEIVRRNARFSFLLLSSFVAILFYRSLGRILLLEIIASLIILLSLNQATHKISKSKIPIKLIVLSQIPFLTQVGTTANVLLNFTHILISLNLLFILSIIELNRSVGDKSKGNFFLLVDQSHELKICSILLILMSLVVLRNSTYTGFEKQLPPIAKYESKIDNLVYSKSKLESIEEFISIKTAATNTVIDFSFWHPGLVYYLKLPISSYSISDIHFAESLESQFMHMYKLDKNWVLSPDSLYMFRTISNNFDSEKCTNISNLQIDANLRNLIIRYYGNFSIRQLTYYKSSIEDLTLYPDYVTLFKRC